MSLDEIVADTDDGLYLASNRSLVDRRPAAQLPVRDRGRLRDQGRQEGPAVQEPDLHRDHLRVLASCDAVGDERSYVMLGTPNCGKGEPGQTGHVGHAVPAPRFRDVQVGVGKW
jgi:TldD protein